MKYRVTCPDWGENDDNPFITEAYGPDHAAHEWCKHGEDNSWFVDGWPDYLLLKIVGEDGEVHLRRASTEFVPSYNIYDEED